MSPRSIDNTRKVPVVLNGDELYKESAVDSFGKPPVTKRNINDEYVRDPPHNQDLSTEEVSPGNPRGLNIQVQSDAQTSTRKRAPIKRRDEEVLGLDEPLGRELKTEELEDLAVNDSVHR